MPLEDHLSAATEAYRGARAAIAAYRLPEAGALLGTARRHLAALPRPERMDLDQRIRLTESWLICDARGLPAALAQIEAVLQEAATAADDNLVALARIQAGVLHARAGNFEEALEQLRPAVKYATRLPLDDRVRLLLNKGTIGSQTGALAEAAADLRAAAELGKDLPAYRFMALHNLGFVEYLRGDLPAALQLMAQADGLEVEVDRSVARHDRARVLLEAGLIEEATELFEQAVAELQLAGLAEEWAEARLDQARCAALAGDPGQAVRLAEGVLAQAAGRGETARTQEARAARLEALVLGSGPGKAQLAAQAAALAADARATGRPWLADRAAALQLIAAAEGPEPELGDPQALRGLRRMRASPYLSTRLLAVLAGLCTTTDPARRGRLLRAAARDTAAARAGMASLDLRTAVAVHLAPIMRSDLERVAASGDGWAALRATERWRAALAEVPSVLPPADDAAAALFATLRRLREELRTAAPGPAGALRVAAGRIERQLREHHWTHRTHEPEGLPGPVGRAELSAVGVLSYFWSADALHLVQLAPGAPARLLPLAGRAEVSDLIAAALADTAAAGNAPAGPLSRAVRSSLNAALQRLEQLVLPEDLGNAPLVIIPSGELARLPWGMLPRLRHRGFTLSRSVAAWAAGGVRLAGPPSVAVVAGPGLALAEAECAAVAGCWAGARPVPAEPAALKAALAAYDVVHIAAHGQHREDSPLFSSLRLHGGSLFAHELEQVPIRASLVVLSACSAGRGRLRPGDEALGLTSSLLAMGVGAVVAPLTDIPDALAERTMAGLHRRLASGQEGPAALAAACDGPLERSFAWFGSDWRAGPGS
ncbi:CHAT domain-containing protein [Glutamicibacter sp. AOP12-B1-11]|uniref:CHAT domain-containing protein n=1 Tax=Glutamicibacter sp. AOP12-B1-11 TaxID=3457725 RepID=UPI004033F2D7